MLRDGSLNVVLDMMLAESLEIRCNKELLAVFRSFCIICHPRNVKRLVNRLFSVLETVFAESLQHWDECGNKHGNTGQASAVQLSSRLAPTFQVHVDEKNPSMFRELSQWVDDEGLEHAVDIFSELLEFLILVRFLTLNFAQ